MMCLVKTIESLNYQDQVKRPLSNNVIKTRASMIQIDQSWKDLSTTISSNTIKSLINIRLLTTPKLLLALVKRCFMQVYCRWLCLYLCSTFGPIKMSLLSYYCPEKESEIE